MYDVKKTWIRLEIILSQKCQESSFEQINIFIIFRKNSYLEKVFKYFEISYNR